MASSPRQLGRGSAESRRLVDDGATAKELLLLRAAIEESPPSCAGRRRTLAALGIAVGASAVTSTAAAAVAWGKAAALAPPKWVVAGAVGAGLAVGGLQLASPLASSHSKAPAVASVGRKATAAFNGAAPSASPLSTAAPPTPHPVETDVRAAPVRATAARPSTFPRAALPLAARNEAVSAAELVAQVDALDRARAALHAGRAGQSLTLLEGFARRYPGSRLGPEATVVRVNALLALGQRTQATELVRSYCRAGGRGAYGRRLMELVGLSETALAGSEPAP